MKKEAAGGGGSGGRKREDVPMVVRLNSMEEGFRGWESRTGRELVRQKFA